MLTLGATLAPGLPRNRQSPATPSPRVTARSAHAALAPHSPTKNHPPIAHPVAAPGHEPPPDWVPDRPLQSPVSTVADCARTRPSTKNDAPHANRRDNAGRPVPRTPGN